MTAFSQIETIADRYRITGTLGQGNSCITYAALDLHTQQPVALKALSLQRLSDWKALELFEREARILAQLDHPAIPRYLNYFQEDSEDDRTFYLVQQLAPGKSLAQLVQLGWQPDEAQVKQLAKTFLLILVYLQSLTPPVIHRDIKPHNILLDPEGQLFLVDFGSVQDAYRHTVMGGSTIVGTFGYMAPEQFRGQAVLSTDLYGLGTTLLFLLTGKSPADLPQRKLKLQFRDRVSLSPAFALWLERLIEPSQSDRFQDAAEALAVLQGTLTMPAKPIIRRKRPNNTLITLAESDNQLLIDFSSVNQHDQRTRLLKWLLPILRYGFPVGLLMSLIWLIIMHNSRGYYEPGPNPNFHSIVLYWVTFITFFCLIAQSLFSSLLKILWRDVFPPKLVITSQGFAFYYYALKQQQYLWATTEDIEPVRLRSIKSLRWLAPNATVVTLKAKPKQKKVKRLEEYQFGLLLTQAEKAWLVGEIHAFLDRTRHC